MSKCNTCKNNLKFGGDGWSACDGCIHDTGLKDRHEPATNADRIRAMSDEELAKWIAERYVTQKTVEAEQRGETLTATQISASYRTCYCVLLDWFKRPYKEDV